MLRLERLSNQINKRNFDYIIVGAGMGGLYSAQLLAENGVTNFLILEAQQGVGGRVQTIKLGEITETNKYKWIKNNSFLANFAIEKGATWIEQSHHLLLHLASTLGVNMRRQYRQGVSTFLDKNRTITTQQILSTASYAKPLLTFISNLEKLSQQYSKNVIDKQTVDQDYKKMVLKYDNMTLMQYIKNELQNGIVQQIVHGFLEHIECLNLNQDSMHQILLRVSRSGDLETLTQWLRLQQEPSYIVNGGTQIFLQKFQLQIQKNIGVKRNQFIKFESEVVGIDNSVKNSIKIKVNKHGTIVEYTCKNVILNVPVGVLSKLSITNLSQTKQIIFSNQTRNLVKKSFIITRRPFWRQKHTGDGLYSNEFNISMSHDVSPINNECGIMVFFHCGQKYTKWHEQFPLNMPNRPQHLRNYFRTILARMYLNGNQESPELEDIIYIDMNMIENRFVNSAFQSNCKPGTMTKLLNSGQVFQRYYDDQNELIFIGSEFSDDYNSYMQGAVRSASKKIHKILKKPDPVIELDKHIEALRSQQLQLNVKKN